MIDRLHGANSVEHRPSTPTSSAPRASLVLGLILVSSHACANGGMDPFLATPITLSVYEVAVVIVEYLLIRRLLRQPWKRALAASALANLVSFLVGAFLAVGISYKLVDTLSEQQEGYAVLFRRTMPLLFVLNFAVEALVVLLVCRLRPTGRLVLFIALIHLITWPVGALLFAPTGRPARRSLVARTQTDMRSLESGLEAYFVDNNTYPSPVPLEAHVPPERRRELAKAGGSQLDVPGGLTTPVAYLTSLFPDPFGARGTPYAYFGDSKGWILLSPGPDRIYDINPANDYSSSAPQYSDRLRVKLYDPSNGVLSRGDIARVKDPTLPIEVWRPPPPTRLQRAVRFLFTTYYD